MSNKYVTRRENKITSEEREATGATQHTTDHMLCCLLQPMANSVFEHLIPHHQSCVKEDIVSIINTIKN